MHEIQLFGAMQVRYRGTCLSNRDFGGVKPRQILALLALHGTLHKDELAELLWHGNPPTNHTATLESYVSLLRRKVDPTAGGRQSVIVTRNGGYALDADRVRTDVDRFDALLASAAGQDAEHALPALTAAVRLADRPLLADEPHATWAVDARERYRARLIEATLRAGEHALRLGDARAAQEHADRATALDPFAERAWHLRMSAHRAVGERAAALRAYDECRRLLADNLGVEPAPAIRQLFLDLLREDGQSTTVDAAMAAVLAAAHELGARPELAAGGRVIALLTRAVELAAPVPSGAALDRVS